MGSNLGSLYARVAGASNPVSGIPNAAVLAPPAVGKKYKNLGGPIDRVTPMGELSSAFKPFDPSAGGQVIQNMQLSMSEARLDHRRNLLSQLDGLKREAEQNDLLAGADRFQQQAFDVILGGVSQAFDLAGEDPATISQYDTSAFEIPPKLKRKKSNVPRQSPITLGKQMLLARRLVEAGCGFVTVTSAGWDMHGNAFGINDGMPLLGSAVDKAVSAFLDDLKQRGLSEKVMLVITGEFGRTPRINNKGGRDHWGNLCTLAFAGGGLRMGQVVGQSDKTASTPAADPVTLSDLKATIMHQLIDVGEMRLARGIPDDVARAISTGNPIPQLM